jgi:4-methylaminobutanoate oxidase (formaldehyde-forming)
MTSFGKIEVSGPDALSLLRRVACNDVDRPVGSVVYTQMLNSRGGDRRRCDGDAARVRALPRRQRRRRGRGRPRSGFARTRRRARTSGVREETDDWSVIGLWGPRARDVLAARHVGRRLERGAGRSSGLAGSMSAPRRWRSGITYVGELGWELYVEPRWAVQVWDRLMEAGADHGITPGGYRVLTRCGWRRGIGTSGRTYRPDENPFEAGLGFCVALDGDRGLRRARRRRGREGGGRRARLSDAAGGRDAEYVTIYGGEAVRVDGEGPWAELRERGYGFTVERNLALRVPPADVEVGPGGHRGRVRPASFGCGGRGHGAIRSRQRAHHRLRGSRTTDEPAVDRAGVGARLALERAGHQASPSSTVGSPTRTSWWRRRAAGTSSAFPAWRPSCWRSTGRTSG